MTRAWVYQSTRFFMWRCGTVDQPQLAIPLVIRAKSGGPVKQQTAIPPPGLEQQHADVGVLGQPCRQDAPRRTAARDDVVELRHGRPDCNPLVT